MSKLSDKILKMSPRELENGDWAIVHRALVDAQNRLTDFGAGRQTWLDAPIAIAKERSKTSEIESRNYPVSVGAFKHAKATFNYTIGSIYDQISVGANSNTPISCDNWKIRLGLSASKMIAVDNQVEDHSGIQLSLVHIQYFDDEGNEVKQFLNPASTILKGSVVCGAGAGLPSFNEYQQMFQHKSNRCFVLLSSSAETILGKNPIEIQNDLGLPWDDGTDEGIWFDAILAQG